jgi:RNA polymerase sigma-70 factor (ECF subfamily)
MRGFDDHTDLSVLLADTAAKDRTAFAVLYRRTSARLFGIVSRIIQPAPDAEEVLQEVYLRVWRSAQFFNASRGKPMTWLISIARNAAVDEARRRGSRGHGSVSQFDPELHGAAVAQEGADHADLIACLHALDERRREMVHLAYVHGYSREELADRFNSNSSSIKSVLRRTLLFLRSCLLLDPSEPVTQPV